MKRLPIVAAACVFAFSTVMATARVIHERQQHQAARIHHGTQSGELNSKEAAKLQSEQRTIQGDREKALADGKITKRERRSIRHEQNQASKDIRRMKHNPD